MALRDADNTLTGSLARTLAALDLDEKDSAAVQLAREYAALIDAADHGADRAWALRWIGPLYNAALNDLGGTPAARAAMKHPKANAPASKSQLDLLREARAKLNVTAGQRHGR